MKKLVIAQQNKDLKVLGFFNKEGINESLCGKGKYRVITKCQAGFMVTSVIEASSALNALRSYKPKALQSIACIKEMDGVEHNITVFARSGKKVWIAEGMLEEITVGDINQLLFNTALYNQFQYQAVNAKTWADKAYVMNGVEEMVA
jgi:hypothetical protein